MTKQEYIKREWESIVGLGFFYDKEAPDNSGYIRFESTYDYHTMCAAFSRQLFVTTGYNPCARGEYSHIQSIAIRPASLKHMEHNRGWIKIECAEDLPKESGTFWIVDKSNSIEICRFVSDDEAYMRIWSTQFTHYQPVIEPSQPLY